MPKKKKECDHRYLQIQKHARAITGIVIGTLGLVLIAIYTSPSWLSAQSIPDPSFFEQYNTFSELPTEFQQMFLDTINSQSLDTNQQAEYQRFIDTMPQDDSAPEQMSFSASEFNAGSNQSDVPVGTTVIQEGYLDTSAVPGISITDFTYNWQFTAKPSNSTATLFYADTLNTQLTPDQPGTYSLQLQATFNASGEVSTANTTITAIAPVNNTTASAQTSSPNIGSATTAATIATTATPTTIGNPFLNTNPFANATIATSTATPTTQTPTTVPPTTGSIPTTITTTTIPPSTTAQFTPSALEEKLDKKFETLEQEVYRRVDLILSQQAKEITKKFETAATKWFASAAGLVAQLKQDIKIQQLQETKDSSNPPTIEFDPEEIVTLKQAAELILQMKGYEVPTNEQELILQGKNVGFFTKDVPYYLQNFPKPVTRIVTVVLMARLVDADVSQSKYQKNYYSDTLENQWYNGYLGWAHQEGNPDTGIARGYPDGTLKPENNIKLAEFSVILERTSFLFPQSNQ
jgi:hypothetical protein